MNQTNSGHLKTATLLITLLGLMGPVVGLCENDVAALKNIK